MCGVNEAVEKVVTYKGNRIKGSLTYPMYIKSVLEEHGIISSETSREEVKVFVKVFKMGVVDGMIYDVGSTLALGRRDDVENWTSKRKRREILRKMFLEE